MLRRSYQWVVAGLCAVLAIGAVGLTGGEISLDGQLYDLTIAARSLVNPRGDGGPEASPVAVIAFDSRSLDAQELLSLPRTFMAPAWAKLINGVADAGARAIGFDFIFAFSANRFVPGYDRPMLEALQRHGDKVALARSVRTPIAETFDFLLDEGGTGFVEITHDGDGVYRRIRREITVVIEGDQAPSTVPGLAQATLGRAGVDAMPPVVRLSPWRHEETMPTYSFIDVVRCAGRDPAAMKRAFEGRVLFVGTTLPEEDRKTGPGHLLRPTRSEPPPVNPPPQDCRLKPLGASDPTANTIPGVYMHAYAAQAVLSNRLTQAVPLPVEMALVGALAFLAALGGSVMRPWTAAGAAALCAVSLFGGGVVLLLREIWLPSALADVAMAGSGLASTLVRYLLIDQRRRRVERAFGHYLAPEMVRRLSDSDAGLQLGGEAREITVMFADLSGFTALSEKVGPAELMAVTNRYLGYITDAVTATGGTIDKYIGDAVMALWGAPLTDAEHAAQALAAARLALDKVLSEHAQAQARGEIGFSVKIGLNSGLAVVGNVGAERRFNYTAVGETVNIAARLESLPKEYGCYIAIGENSAALVKQRYLLLELDWIRVKGKEKAISVYTPLAELEQASDTEREFVLGFARALANYRAGRFAVSRTMWLALDDPFGEYGPSRIMADRAAEYIEVPPALPFDGIYVRTSK